MKQIVIKITDTFYEKVMRYEVNAPTQLIEAVRQGKELSEVVMEHYRQGREDERLFQKGELMQSFDPDQEKINER